MSKILICNTLCPGKWMKGVFSFLCRCIMFQDSFSIAEPPIWMDSTNTKQVRQLEDAVGGPEVLQTFVKDICGYFQCAPFPRLETGKVVWVLFFDH